MEAAAVAKTEEKKKGAHAASESLVEPMVSREVEAGAKVGMPLFLQRSASSAASLLVQRQMEEEEKVEETPEEREEGLIQPKLTSADTGFIQRQAVTEEGKLEEIPEETKEEEENLQTQLDETQSVVQAKCAKCAEEDAEGGTPPSDDQDVQLWDCTEYDEPTCVQNQLDESEPIVQAKCAACEKEEETQTKSAASKRPSPGTIRREAARGLKGAQQSLPHGDRIKTAFGHHDISGVRTMVGGSAAAASRRMGALAFTAGDKIGFREVPSLHLAAHEAAHTVHQRAGLSLPDRVGQPGDRYERNADQVADAVVAGRSAEGLLDEVAAPDIASGNEGSKSSNNVSTPAEPIVQQRITGEASRLFELLPTSEEDPELATGGVDKALPETSTGEKGAEETETSGHNDESAIEAAIEGEEQPSAAEVPGGSEASEGCGETPSAAGTAADTAAGGGAPSTTADTSAPTAAGSTPETENRQEVTEEDAACYSAKPEDRPEGVEEPSSDERGSEPKEEPAVTCGPWPEEADECPAEDAMTEGSAQMPEGISPDSATGGVLAVNSESTIVASAESGKAVASKEEGAVISRERQGMEAASADQSSEAANVMDSQITSIEGGRDTAINDYLTATSGLGRVLARSQSLKSRVTFPTAEGEQQVVARRAAIREVQEFMGQAAARIATAVAFAQSPVPGILGAAAEGVKVSIQVAIETEKSAISNRIDQAKKQARSKATDARNEINEKYNSSVKTINSKTDNAIAELDRTHETSVGKVDEKETTGLDNVNTLFATGRTQHEAKGPEYAGHAIHKGQQYVNQYERCKKGYKDDGFWDGCLTVRRARAQQDAACKTVAGYKDVFLRTANKKGYDLIALRRRYRCAVIAGASQVNKTLDDTHTKIVSGLDSQRKQALAEIKQKRYQSLIEVNAALNAELASLSAQEFSQRQTVNDTGYLKQVAAEQLAHSGAAGLAQGIAAAMDSLEQTLTTLGERFAQGDIPDPDILADSLATTEAGLGGGMGMLFGKMTEGLQQAQIGIVDLGASALGELASLTTNNDEQSTQAEDSFTQKIKGIKTRASKEIEKSTKKQVQKANEGKNEGTGLMEDAVEGFEDALESIYGKIDDAIAQSLQELDRDLNGKLGELDGQIVTEAWRAAEKEQPAWKDVLAIVLIIVVIIAAAVISIVTLGAGASLFAVILVGALVGAVSGGLIQLINNWASGEDLLKGVGQAMIMGAIGGAIGGGLGFAGGALASGAAAAGARAATQLTITLTSDLLAEAATQSVGYVAFGQEFNWEGFVMAGAMSGVSFRAQPSPRAGVPRAEVPTPRAAGAAAGRRAAVSQVALGAGVGLGVEGLTAWISGKEFDLTKAASAAASGAVGARMARRETAAKPAPETGARRATSAGAVPEPLIRPSISSRLEDLGGRLFGPRPTVEQPPGGRSRTTEEPTTPRVEEPDLTRPRTTEETALTTRTQPEELDVGSRRTPVEEPGVETGRRPIDADTAAELTGPANRMNEQDLINATTTRTRVADTDHDFRIAKECEVCTACDSTKGQLDEMIRTLKPGNKLLQDLEEVHQLVGDVENRLAEGESGIQMIRDCGEIATQFRVLGEQHPTLGRALEDPRLLHDSGETTGTPTTSRHLADLNENVTLTKTIEPSDWRSVRLNRGEDAIYIVRDPESGAVLKVGCAGPTCGGSSDLNRFSQYSNAQNKLNATGPEDYTLNLQIDVAVIRTKRGQSIRDVETRLRDRLNSEGHILPWDNKPSGRLGRTDRGTPFVHPVDENYMWDSKGNIVHKSTGAAPPAPRRSVLTVVEVALLRNEGYSFAEIGRMKGVSRQRVHAWYRTNEQSVVEAIARIKAADNINDIND